MKARGYPGTDERGGGLVQAFLTGAAGFIGSYVVERLCADGERVVGIDNFDATVYAAAPKRDRAARLAGLSGFELHEAGLDSIERLERLLGDRGVDVVIHLAALTNPRMSVALSADYVRVNVLGTANLLEAMRRRGVRKLVLASTSTVYGSDPHVPWREDLPCDRQLAPYAATKRACELLAHTFHVTDDFDVAALRFFNAYGPWGRPDMMPLTVTRALIEGRRFTLFDGGRPKRDFTYVEDVAAGIVAAANRVSGYEIFNIGRGEPVAMIEFVRTLEEITGRRAEFDDAPLPASDAPITYADISKARQMLGYDPVISLRQGLERTVDWVRQQADAR